MHSATNGWNLKQIITKSLIVLVLYCPTNLLIILLNYLHNLIKMFFQVKKKKKESNVLTYQKSELLEANFPTKTFQSSSLSTILSKLNAELRFEKLLR